MPTPPDASPTPDTRPLLPVVLRDVGAGLGYYALTSIIVVLGVTFGHDYLRPADQPLSKRRDLLATFANWDGEWYQRILVEGYAYDPQHPSSVVFFPAYPLLSRLPAAWPGCRPELALLIVSHLSLAGAFILLSRYLRQRYPDAPAAMRTYALLAFGLWPTTLFYRMAYTESLFVFLALLVLYAIERRWPPLAIALVVGLATATRSVGLALLLPLALHLWGQSPRVGRFLLCHACVLPVACWGIAAYVLYQALVFRDPFAFVRGHAHWNVTNPSSWGDKLLALASHEPIWSVFDPSSPCFWGRHEPGANPLFSLQAANPLYFLAAVALVLVGVWTRWLSRYEMALSAGLLLIPYLLRGYEMCMEGMGRFTAVVFPVYLVLGHLLARLPAPVAAALLAVSSFLLGAYAALFAAWYRFF